VLNPSDAASLQNALNSPDQDAYTPVDFVWHAGAWTAEGYLLLEKEITAAPVPEAQSR
jgi:hypothetical protein